MNRHEWFWVEAMKEIDGNELRTDDPLALDETSLLSRAISAIDNLIESTESETSVPEQLKKRQNAQ